MADGHARPAADVDRTVTVVQPGEVDEALVRLAVLDRHHESGDHAEGALRAGEIREKKAFTLGCMVTRTSKATERQSVSND